DYPVALAANAPEQSPCGKAFRQQLANDVVECVVHRAPKSKIFQSHQMLRWHFLPENRAGDGVGKAPQYGAIYPPEAVSAGWGCFNRSISMARTSLRASLAASGICHKAQRAISRTSAI